MHYDVIVSLVFATGRPDEDRYDLWEVQTALDADGPKAALLDAIVLARRFEDWKELGYRQEPILYAVKSVHSRKGMVSGAALDHCRFCVLVGTITEQQVLSLKSFDKISLPYKVMHID
ncbi:MAG: hypothetical protein ABIL01_20720 [Pseudomonadota bacterium]